jgi:patatin-like phospholipase/acyl hydrolase
VVVHPAAIHPLTPGSPAYAMLKVGAIGSIVALRFALGRRNREQHEAAPEEAATELRAERQRSAHPVSRKKKRRRRR